jgi:hypothetical protein
MLDARRMPCKASGALGHQPLKGATKPTPEQCVAPRQPRRTCKSGQPRSEHPMLKISRLELRPVAGRIARVWVNVAAKPTRRTAKAERVAMMARTDWQNGNTLVRVRT